MDHFMQICDNVYIMLAISLFLMLLFFFRIKIAVTAVTNIVKIRVKFWSRNIFKTI